MAPTSLHLAFPSCTRVAVPKPSAGPSAHALEGQDSRQEGLQERLDSSTRGRRWEARWAALWDCSGALGRARGHRPHTGQSFHE